jgi:hypothetical protein
VGRLYSGTWGVSPDKGLYLLGCSHESGERHREASHGRQLQRMTPRAALEEKNKQ